LVGTADRKKPLGRYKHRLGDNIKMDPKEIDRVGVDWINVIQDRGKWWDVFEHGNGHRIP